MPDNERRHALLIRAKMLRNKMDDILTRMTDEQAKLLVIHMVRHKLDDVDGFFLGDPGNRPSTAMHEKMWLDNAEMVLAWAEQSFVSLGTQFAAYGGAENVQVIGMK
jgi:hypothetical protein